MLPTNQYTKYCQFAPDQHLIDLTAVDHSVRAHPKELRSYSTIVRHELPYLRTGIDTRNAVHCIDHIFSTAATDALYIGNGGAACDFTHTQLHNIFSEYGAVVDIILHTRLSYSVVVYTNADSAYAARRQLHKQTIAQRTLYVQYVNTEYIDLAVRHSNTLDEAVFLETISKNACLEYAQLHSTLQHRLQLSDSNCCMWSDSTPIPGLLLLNNFITASGEADLLQWLDTQHWNIHKLRHVQHYGYAFNYHTNSIDINQRIGDLPPELQHIVDRMQFIHTTTSETSNAVIPRSDGHYAFTPDQLTVNRYLPSHGIPPHCDSHTSFNDVVVSLSLQSAVVMQFEPASQSGELKRLKRCALREQQLRNNELDQNTVLCRHCIANGRSSNINANKACLREPKLCKYCCMAASGNKTDCGQHSSTYDVTDAYITDSDVTESKQPDTDDIKPISIVLPARSLLVLRGAARYAYIHTIPARKTDRYNGVIHERQTRTSLTFRNVRHSMCTCEYPEICDSRLQSNR